MNKRVPWLLAIDKNPLFFAMPQNQFFSSTLTFASELLKPRQSTKRSQESRAAQGDVLATSPASVTQPRRNAVPRWAQQAAKCWRSA